MKLSVVTLSFNQRSFLKEAMDSVLNQGVDDLEYIVLDPGSSDGSRELIEQSRSRLASIIFEPDNGPADGLNKGFAHATGQILAFLNADDFYLPGVLPQVVDYFKQHPDCDLLMGNGYIIDGNGHKRKHIKARGFTVGRYLHGGSRWLQQATFFRRSVFEQSSGFNIANRTCWDGELFVGMVSNGARVHYFGKDVAAFRIHQTSISGSGSNLARYHEDCRRIFRETAGRPWGIFDGGTRIYYRAESLLRRFTVDRWL